MKLNKFAPHHQRAVMRLVLSNPYLRGAEPFTKAINRMLDLPAPLGVEASRRLRYDVYERCGLKAEGQGWVALVVENLPKLIEGAAQAWDDDRLGKERRTAAIGVRQDGVLSFMGGPKDRLVQRAGWIVVRNGEAGWVDCPGEPSEEPLEPPRKPQKAVEPEEAPLPPPKDIPLSLDTLMPLVLRAMRAANVTSIAVSDDPALGPRVNFSGKLTIDLGGVA